MANEKKQLSDFEIANWLRKQLLTKFGELINYQWSDEYKQQTMDKAVAELKEVKSYRDIVPANLTYEEAKELGFGRWDEGTDLMLIPIWLAPFIKLGITLETISGRREKWKKDSDKDHRFGCLSYGWFYPDAMRNPQTTAEAAPQDTRKTELSKLHEAPYSQVQTVSSGSYFGAQADEAFRVITNRILEAGPKKNCKFVFFVGPKQVGKSTIAAQLHDQDGYPLLPFNAWAYRAQREWLKTCEQYEKDEQTLLTPFTGRNHMTGFMDAVIKAFGTDYLAWQYSQDLRDLWSWGHPDFIINDSVRRQWEIDYIQKLANKGYNVTVVNVYREGCDADASHETEFDWRENVWPENVNVMHLRNDMSVEMAAMLVRDFIHS